MNTEIKPMQVHKALNKRISTTLFEFKNSVAVLPESDLKLEAIQSIRLLDSLLSSYPEIFYSLCELLLDSDELDQNTIAVDIDESLTELKTNWNIENV